ncbi:MAG TPA: UvrD-helicase domain-containing protein [Chloroflexia bacterium]|nr:UvrD-helicase domain-containing protein [Chloroflexia bacterium]
MTLSFEVARKAYEQHEKALEISKGDFTSSALISAAVHLTDLNFFPVGRNDTLLDGGHAKLVSSDNIVWYDEDAGVESYNFYIAHELAHFWLGHPADTCSGKDFDPEIEDMQLSLGVDKIEGYSPQEKKEREANQFAREFLLPGSKLQHWFVTEKLGIKTIANRAGVSEGLVLQQLSRVLLVAASKILSPPPDDVQSESELDESQKEAAFIENGPLLVDAGPGTGKTKTLVKRIVHLLEKGVAPESILALTFSNQAAEEMRERVARQLPKEASKIWMGTFHAFGLELLRKYGEKLGLPAKPGLIDPVSGLFVLERLLPSLNLDYYLDLFEPTRSLADIQTAISRAKDELVGAERYSLEAQKMLDQASDPAAVEEAQKALEVAGVYTKYQEYLDSESLLDFGDLISKAYRLLAEHGEVKKAVGERYQHILVDEFQDVNYASGRFIEELSGDGSGLWVVGDLRQSIYRFRGASPKNLTLLKDRFENLNIITLKRNYRSRPAILKTFSTFAPRMKATAGQMFTPWETHRNDEEGQLVVGIAQTLEAEIKGLANQMKKNQAEGIAYQEQAVLCRTHTTLERVAALLEEEDIPVLYLGDLFEREEIRDLLSLVSLVCEGAGSGLVRVAAFNEYQIPVGDVQTLLNTAREREISLPTALNLARELPAISFDGQKGFSLLAEHLDGISIGRNAWQFLVYYLFDRSNYLKKIFEDTSVKGKQKNLAIYQFLQFTHAQQKKVTEGNEDPRRAFLNYIRKIEAQGEDRLLRQALDGADGVEAVRLLTVHASKGLEFKAVYLPYLGNGYFPGSLKAASPCPLPSGLGIARAKDWHQEEEECLLFVALSRAKDFLCLSRSQRYGQRSSKASEEILTLKNALPYPPDGPVNWVFDTSELKTTSITAPVPYHKEIFDTHELETYRNCARRYYYEFVLKLSKWVEESAYKKFHASVYQFIDWIKEQNQLSLPIDEGAALEHLSLIWTERGPTEHPFEALYRTKAEIMVLRALDYFSELEGTLSRPEWEVTLPNGRVRFTPDQVERQENQGRSKIIIHRFKTGKPNKNEDKQPVYSLYRTAASKIYPDVDLELRIAYLGKNEQPEPGQTPAKIIPGGGTGDYEAAIAGIRQGEFSANQKDKRKCPGCPYYFICPAG